jgi:elongation factor Ts
MAQITAGLVQELRKQTGAGMMDCKKALEEAEGDLDKAVEVLRKKGLKSVSKRAAKVAAEGTVGTYVHPGDQIAVLVELNCETDFVARGEDFKDLARGIAMHVAAMKPVYLAQEDVPSAVIEKEKEIYLEQLTDAQRANAEKILPGKLKKFYEDNVLLDQLYIRDESSNRTVREVVDELSARVGEKIAIRRFHRFEVGEGIEKQVVDLAADVEALRSGTA